MANPTEALFYELLGAASLATVVSEDPNANEPYLGEVFFPREKVDGFTLSYIKDTRGVPMALKPSQYDVATPIRDRARVELFENEMFYFKTGMTIGERETAELLKVLSYRSTPESYKTILRRIYNDRVNLVIESEVASERLRMQALSTGLINVVANGEYLSADYGIPNTQKWTVASADEWNKPAADVLKTIKAAKTVVRNANGTKLRYMLMHSKTFDNLLVNAQFKSIISPLAPNVPVILEETLKQAIETYTGLRVITYDKVFKDEDGVVKPFFPEGVVTFLPEGAIAGQGGQGLGRTNYGTTPQEAQLLYTSNHRAEVAIVNTGVAITTYKKEDPVSSETIVSQVVMPSFEQAANVVIVTVYTP